MKALSILLLASVCAFGQNYRSSCSVHPEFCKDKISPLSQEEKQAIEKADAKWQALWKQLEAAGKKHRAVVEKAVKDHGMSNFPAVVRTDDLEGLMGGTCLGTIEINPDGYLVYKPASDISSCEENVIAKKTKQ